MRRDVGWVQLCRDGQVLDCFFEIATFLDEFMSQPVPTEKSLWVFGNHLSEGIKIHAGLLVSVRRMIPLHGRREPDLSQDTEKVRQQEGNGQAPFLLAERAR